MSIVERPTKSMTEQAVDALKAFEPMVAMVLQYGDLTVEADGIGKVEEAHKALKRLRIDVDDKRSELNAPALEYQRTVNATAKELIAQITTAESKLKSQRDIHDAEKLREKQAKEAAKAATLNERVQRLTSAGVIITDLAALGLMAGDEFEFFFAKESRVAAEAKAESELQQKIKIRTARMEALGVACPSPEQIGTLSDAQFEHDYVIAKQLIDRSNAALKAEQEAEAKRQAEELRVRAEEIERQRLADEALMAEERARMKSEREAAEARQAEERKAMEADRAEMRRQQEEIAKQQAELRAKAEAEAKEERRKAAEAEQTRREAAAAPELEKLEVVLKAMKNAGSRALTDCGVPRWSGEIAEHFEIFAKVARQTVLESL